MVGWDPQLSGYEFERTPGDSEGQGSLECSSPWVCKELYTTQPLNNNLCQGKHICQAKFKEPLTPLKSVIVPRNGARSTNEQSNSL